MQIDEQINNAISLIQNNKTNEGISLLKKINLEFPDDSYVNYMLGYAYRQNNQLDNSVFHFAEAIKINNEYDSAYVGIGVTLQKLLRFDEAIKYLEQAISINPYNDDAYNSLGYTHILNSEPEFAIEKYIKGIEILFHKIYNHIDSTENREYIPDDMVNEKFKVDNWFSIAIQIITYHAGQDGMENIQMPTDETAIRLSENNIYGNNIYIDDKQSRKILPNMFNNFADKLSWNITYSNFMSNIGFAYLRLEEKEMAKKYFIESILFIPEKDDFQLPFMGLQEIEGQ